VNVLWKVWEVWKLFFKTCKKWPQIA
jgi:hypothetical protein